MDVVLAGSVVLHLQADAVSDRVTLQRRREYLCRPSGVSRHSYLYCNAVPLERHARDSVHL